MQRDCFPWQKWPSHVKMAIERQLVGFFIDGLAHDNLKMKVMRENPATLQAAVAFAMTEQNSRKRFNLRIGRVTDSNVCHIEPMEIDHLRPTKHCFKCNKLGHCARDCHNRPYAYIEPMEFDYARSPNYCHVCNQLGHLASHCLIGYHINAVASINPDGDAGRKELYSRNGNFLNNRGNRQMRSKAHFTVWNRRDKGHYQNECRAPPSGQNRGNISEN